MASQHLFLTIQGLFATVDTVLMPPPSRLLAHTHRLQLSPRAPRPVSLSVRGRKRYDGMATLSVMEKMMENLRLEE